MRPIHIGTGVHQHINDTGCITMPVYSYYCDNCKDQFDKMIFSPDSSDLKSATCPKCGRQADRTYLGYRFSSPSVSINSELLEDEEPYRRMHYYEKKKDWENAAKAAEGVSDFARKKFQQKAENNEK